MGFLDQIKSLITTPADPFAMWLYVKCKRCGSPVAVRVDLRNDPSVDYDSGGYVLYKDIMDDKCFTLMRAEIHLDAKHQVKEQKIDKGEFITQADYQSMVKPQ